MADSTHTLDAPEVSGATPKAAAQPSPRVGRLLMACMIVFIVYTVLYVGLWKPMSIFGVDYDKHWQAARAILTGESNYIGGKLWIGFNYPQASAFTFIWLGWMSVEVAEKVWKLTLLGLLVACWAMGWRSFRPRPALPGATDSDTAGLVRRAFHRHWGLIVAFAICAFEPATSCLYLGNIDPVNAFYGVAMVAALLSGKPRWAGGFWALLTLVKMLPLALLIPVLLWRRWRVLEGFLIAMAVYFVVLVVTGRLHHEWFFVQEIIPAIPPWWRYISITPIRLGLHLCGLDRLCDDPHTFGTIGRLNTLAMTGFYVGALALLRRRGLDWLRGLEIAILLFLLMTPLLEYHHFVWIMPALLLQMRRWAEGGMAPRVAGGLLVGYALLFASYHLDMIYARWGLWVHFTPLIGYGIILAAAFYESFKYGSDAAALRDRSREAQA